MEVYIVKQTNCREHEQVVRLLLRHDCWAGTICGVFEDRNTAIHLAREWNRKNRNLEYKLYYTVEKQTVREFKI